MIEIVKVRNDLAPLMVDTAIQEKRGGLNSYLFDALSDCVPSPFEQKHVDTFKQYRDKAQARSEWDRCNNALQDVLKAMQKHNKPLLCMTSVDAHAYKQMASYALVVM